MKKYFLTFCLIVASVLFIITQSSAATFTVNSTADETDVSPGNGICASASRKCTLRAAVVEANALAGTDSITLLAKTYVLSLTGTGEDAAATGDLDVTSTVNITGTSLNSTIIDARGIDRVFHIFSGASYTNFSKMTVTGGVSAESGGGIVNAAENVDLDEVKITGNSVTNTTNSLGGGGVYNTSGNIDFNDCFISENTVHNSLNAYGGGIYIAGGSFRLLESRVEGNTAESAYYYAFGGGIADAGIGGSIEDSVITGNHATSYGTGSAGGGIFSAGTDLDFRQTQITTNSSYGANNSFAAGGGIYIQGDRTEMFFVEIDHNMAWSYGDTGSGGGIYGDGEVDHCSIHHNSSVGSEAYGGGIQIGIVTLGSGMQTESAGVMLLTESDIYNNIALASGHATVYGTARGGGVTVMVEGVLDASSSEIYENTAQHAGSSSASAYGGGVHNLGSLYFRDGTIRGNTSQSDNYGVYGGGLSNYGGEAYLTNATISENLSESDSTSSTLRVAGGGVYNHYDVDDADLNGSLTATSSTIAQNKAVASSTNSYGGGIDNNIKNPNLHLTNTILARNGARYGDDCYGRADSQGYNLIGNVNDCYFVTDTGDQYGDSSSGTRLDPIMAPLGNNGGGTQTHALMLGSPAIDGGNPAGCEDYFTLVLTTDQRGLPRAVDGSLDGIATCDIGAYERQ